MASRTGQLPGEQGGQPRGRERLGWQPASSPTVRRCASALPGASPPCGLRGPRGPRRLGWGGVHGGWGWGPRCPGAQRACGRGRGRSVSRSGGCRRAAPPRAAHPGSSSRRPPPLGSVGTQLASVFRPSPQTEGTRGRCWPVTAGPTLPCPAPGVRSTAPASRAGPSSTPTPTIPSRPTAGGGRAESPLAWGSERPVSPLSWREPAGTCGECAQSNAFLVLSDFCRMSKL